MVDPLAEKFYSVNQYNYTDNNPANNIDPDGMETYYGQEAQDMFRQIQMAYMGNNDEDEKKKKKEEKTIGQSYLNGIVGGAKGTWEFIKRQFTWEGYLDTEANLFTLGIYGWLKNAESNAKIVANIPNYDQYDYAYAAGYLTEQLAEAYLTKKVGGYAEKAVGFQLNEGYGVFGKKGLKIGNYKIEAFYGNQEGTPGGTILSIKEQKRGGNMLRWDKGKPHSGSAKMTYHSTFRFNVNGSTYGSAAQYPVTAPFVFWKYKKT